MSLGKAEVWAELLIQKKISFHELVFFVLEIWVVKYVKVYSY